MSGKHALLSPSGAKRWMTCTPSAKLEQQFEDKGSDYAAEGTLAHSVAELKVRKQFLEPMGPKAFEKALNKLKKTKLYENGQLRKVEDYWPEILTCTDEYLDYINKTTLSYPSRPYVAAEQQLDLSNYIPEGFGTGDCIVIGSDTLHIMDYKHGKGVPVDADHNPQTMSYALGALERYQMLYSIKKVVMTIVQPRLNNISEFVMSAENLINWGVFTLRPKAQAAFAGEGDYIPGEHCRFCRAKARCRVRSNEYTALEDFKGLNAHSKTETGTFPVPPLLTDAEVGGVLQKVKELKQWAKDLEEYALSAILNGQQIPGWKAVEGQEGNRAFDDTEGAFDVIKNAGYDEALLYKREHITIPEAEKLVGKKKFTELVGTHIVRAPGKPALVLESDKRLPYQPKTTAAEDFKPENLN